MGDGHAGIGWGMSLPSATLRQQRSSVLGLVTAFVVVLLLVQLWLLVEAIEGHLGGAGSIVGPAAIASGACFAAAVWLWRMMQR